MKKFQNLPAYIIRNTYLTKKNPRIREIVPIPKHDIKRKQIVAFPDNNNLRHFFCSLYSFIFHIFIQLQSMRYYK